MPSPRRTRQPRMPLEARREQVLDAALRLIDSEGYAAATMEAIAREANIAKPVVYNGFPSRGELLRSLLEREQTRAFGALAAALPPRSGDADPREALLTWVVSLGSAVVADPVTWRLMLLPADETPAIVRKHVNEGRQLVLAQAQMLISGILDQRSELASIDRELAGHLLVAAAEQSARLMLSEPDSFTPQRIASFAANVVDAVVR